MKHPVYARFCELAAGSWTAMTSVNDSALAGHLLLKWQGVNGARHSVRINPHGTDLEDVLVEFADQCRELSK